MYLPVKFSILSYFKHNVICVEVFVIDWVSEFIPCCSVDNLMEYSFDIKCMPKFKIVLGRMAFAAPVSLQMLQVVLSELVLVFDLVTV